MTLTFALTQQNAASHETDALILGIYADGSMPKATQEIDDKTAHLIQALYVSKDIKGEPGETRVLFNPANIKAKRIVLTGLGDPEKLDAQTFKKIADKAFQLTSSLPIKHATSFLSALAIKAKTPAWCVRTEAISADYAAYRYLETLSKRRKANTPSWEGLDIYTDAPQVSALQEAKAITEGIRFARHLGNTPPNICNPEWLAEQAEQMAAKYPQVKANILDADAMDKIGMHSLLAVARGSSKPPRLIVLEYNGTDSDQAPYALVGKGVTFDSGGLNIKPGASMEQMKFDMCGGAGMLGTFMAVAALRLPINLVCAVAAVENMPDGDSYRAGDVLTTLSGQTVEVLNTDAEGRLILCDTLTYVQRYKPQAIVDAATLTGACVVALGKHASGLMSKHDDLANELLAAGDETLDRAWRLPLWDDYQKDLESAFADFAHIGNRNAGAIAAGCFLSRFTEGQRWAHLDIAGTAWDDGRKGLATGRPVALLSQWLINQSA